MRHRIEGLEPRGTVRGDDRDVDTKTAEYGRDRPFDRLAATRPEVGSGD